MRILSTLLLLLILQVSFLVKIHAKVDLPVNLSHDTYEKLLKKYVDVRGLVNYAAWKREQKDMQALNIYLRAFENKADGEKLLGNDLNAALTNIYNALTIKWILDNYPIKSIKDTNKPWQKSRYRLGGEAFSLDAIEHKVLRPRIGYKVHAILVCAAKSCPPLQRFAYNGTDFERQVDIAFRAWLSRPDLNHFSASENALYLSKIFDWYREDFGGKFGLRTFIKGRARLIIKSSNSEKNWQSDGDIKFMKYDWALNRQ